MLAVFSMSFEANRGGIRSTPALMASVAPSTSPRSPAWSLSATRSSFALANLTSLHSPSNMRSKKIAAMRALVGVGVMDGTRWAQKLGPHPQGGVALRSPLLARHGVQRREPFRARLAERWRAKETAAAAAAAAATVRLRVGVEEFARRVVGGVEIVVSLRDESLRGRRRVVHFRGEATIPPSRISKPKPADESTTSQSHGAASTAEESTSSSSPATPTKRTRNAAPADPVDKTFLHDLDIEPPPWLFFGNSPPTSSRGYFTSVISSMGRLWWRSCEVCAR